jgi:hypothetical protein
MIDHVQVSPFVEEEDEQVSMEKLTEYIKAL